MLLLRMNGGEYLNPCEAAAAEWGEGGIVANGEVFAVGLSGYCSQCERAFKVAVEAGFCDGWLPIAQW